MGSNALCRVGVVGTAGGVDVVVAAEEAVGATGRSIAPVADVERSPRPGRGRSARGSAEPVLGASAVSHADTARRQEHGAAVGAVDLPLEEQVGGDPLGLRRMDSPRAVDEGEVRDGRRAVVVADAEPDRDAGRTSKRTGTSPRKPRSWVPWPTSKPIVASRLPASLL